jgi:hypothetical protein
MPSRAKATEGQAYATLCAYLFYDPRGSETGAK